MTEHAHHLDHKDNSLDRLVFFSDGVFAIAITLLSIELHPPHGWDGTAASLWSQGWTGFMAYAVSFVVIGVFWNSHRRIFNQVNRFTPGVFAWNLALLGAIALMPFVTSLLYITGPKSQAFAVYLGLVSVAGLIQGLLLAQAAFVDRAVRPGVHWARRVTAALAAGLLPGLMSAATMLFYARLAGSGVPLILPIGLMVVAVAVIAAQIWAGRRFRS